MKCNTCKEIVAHHKLLARKYPLYHCNPVDGSGNLDSKSGHEIMGIFDRLHNNGNTIILVTHEDEIAKHANRTIKLLDGKIIEDNERKD